MKLAKLPVTILLVLLPATVSAATGFGWSLNQHSKDKNLTSKPALVQYTEAREGDSSYTIDGALKGSLLPDESAWEYSLTGEAHRNSLIKKEQNLVSAGIQAEGSWGKLKEGYVIIPTFSADLKLDEIKDNESLLVIGEVTGIYGKIHLNHEGDSDLLRWGWTPTVAMEYEDIFNTENNGPDGDVARFYTSATVVFYPFFKKLDDGRLKLSASFSNWQDFVEDDEIDDGDDSHDLIQSSISWRLTDKPENPKDRKFAVTLNLDWWKGEDPRHNKSDQEYVQVGFGFQY